MAETTGISWCHHTFNPWRGCTKVSGGCKNCYADALSGRNPTTLGIWGPKGTRPIAAEAYWRGPLKWDRDAERAGERRRVFCASLADVFEGPETMPDEAWEAVTAARHRLFRTIFDTPHLDWLLLTKRPENVMRRVIAARNATKDQQLYDELLYPWSNGAPPANVWLGVSVEDQAAADARIPHLLRIPAAVRFLSCEPLLGLIEFAECKCRGNMLNPQCPTHGGSDWSKPGLLGIDWVIGGFESGPNARPGNPAWARSLRDQCARAAVPFHWKQNGEWLAKSQGGQYIPGRADLFREFPNGEAVYKVGVKRAGRLLDGVLHDSFPEVPRAR